MKETVTSLCFKVDDLSAEIGLALDALSIIHEAMTETHPKAEQFSNAVCSVYLNLCNLTEQLQDLTEQAMRNASQQEKRCEEISESAAKKICGETIAGKEAVRELLAFGSDVNAKFCAVLDLLGDDSPKVKEFWDLWEKL